MRSIEFDGVAIQLAETDAEWSALVLAKNDGRCVLCSKPATPAHIISRRYLRTRLVVENGQPLCVGCHTLYDTMGEKDGEKMAVILIGQKLFDILFRLSRERDEVVIWK